MAANDVQAGQTITSNCTTGGPSPLDGRWMWVASCFFALLPFIRSRALKAYLFSLFLRAFTKANDTPMDSYL